MSWRHLGDLDRPCLPWGWSHGLGPGVLSIMSWLLAACGQHPSISMVARAGKWAGQLWAWSQACQLLVPSHSPCPLLRSAAGQAQLLPLCLALDRDPESVSLLGRRIQSTCAESARTAPGVSQASFPSPLSSLSQHPRSPHTPVHVCCSHFSDGFICPHLHKKYHTPQLNEQAHLAVQASSRLRAVRP